MDYEFTMQTNNVSAVFSMGHEAIGSWFTNELGTHLDKIDSLLTQAKEIKNGQRHQLHIDGCDLQLDISRISVEIRNINEDRSLDGLEEGDDAELYDQENNAECGLDDFIEALISWREFIPKSL